jgi:hypothetical protein
VSTVLAILFQESSGNSPAANAMAIGGSILWLAIAILMSAALWKVFTKAGEPGWAAIVPIYNFFVLLKIAGKPWWWLLLTLIPFVIFIIVIIMSIDVAKNFGKGTGFGLGLLFLPFIFYPILAWGDARYQPRAA